MSQPNLPLRLMQSLTERIIRFPRIAILLVLGTCAAFTAGTPRLQFDSSTASLFQIDDPEVDYYRNVRANFGTDSVVTVVARTGDLFIPETLETLREFSVELSRIQGVKRTVSAFDLNLISRYGEYFRSRPLIESIPRNPEAIARLRDSVLGNRLARDSLINAKGTAAAYYLFVPPEYHDPGLEQRLFSDLESRINRLRGSLGNEAEVYMLGAPLVKFRVLENIRHDLVVLGPITLLVIGLVILVFYRSFLAAVLPLITGSLSVLATLGFMGFAGFSLNPISSPIIVFLLVIGCTEDLHLVAEYGAGLQRGFSRNVSVLLLGGPTGSAVFLTAITTFLGFLTLTSNPVSGIRDFAFSLAVGIILNFLITITLVPAIFRLLPARRRPISPIYGRLRDDGEGLARSVLRHRRRITFGFAIVIVFLGFGVSRLDIDTNYLRFFPSNSPVSRAFQAFAEDFGGTTRVSVIVETGTDRGIYRRESLQQIANLTDEIRSRFGYAFSVADIVRDLHFQLNEGKPAFDRIPVNQDDVDLCRAILRRMNLEPYVDYNASRAAIHVRTTFSGTREMVRAESEILGIARETLPPDFEVRVTGEQIVIGRFSHGVVRQLSNNILTLFLIVTVLLVLFFRSIRFGLLALLPNAFPILVVIGSMGWFGIPLSAGNFPVAIIAFGIAVDDTIHFMTRYIHETARGREQDRAVAIAISREFQPVLTTTAALALGYLVLLFSPFSISRENGILFATAFAAALLADLLVTPVLLSAVSAGRRRGKRFVRPSKGTR